MSLSNNRNYKKVVFSFFLYVIVSGPVLGEINSCLKSHSLQRVSCGENDNKYEKVEIHNHNSFQTEPSFIAYRLAFIGSSERKCRFQPTCSQFLIESIKRHGFVKGTRNAFARAQMLHDDQFGTLKTELRENFLVFLDPAYNWDEK